MMFDLTGYRVKIDSLGEYVTIRGVIIHQDNDGILIDGKQLCLGIDYQESRMLIPFSTIKVIYIIEKPAEEKFCLYCGVSRVILENSISKAII